MKLLLGLALAAALTACGGGDDSGTAPKAADAQKAIETNAQAYSDAYLTGDGDAAYALLSKRCQERMSAAEFGALVDAAADEYGSELSFGTFAAEVNGNQARVTYTYTDNPEINQADEPWVLEDGDWHEDDC